eukprot:TRINITY_DN27259_c0_g1_i3.p1 TRINITY_DN27259_c0_g1~~TRINITY_DN27259_c0_g1_i3.p1  ORF type:complete len:137 (-),score=9.81 TRINITY_DN27259_c0_g1_i3:36-446(-)
MLDGETKMKTTTLNAMSLNAKDSSGTCNVQPAKRSWMRLNAVLHPPRGFHCEVARLVLLPRRCLGGVFFEGVGTTFSRPSRFDSRYIARALTLHVLVLALTGSFLTVGSFEQIARRPPQLLFIGIPALVCLTVIIL